MMTIEEKAKAYDEALEKARKKHDSKYHPDMGPGGVYLNNADLEEIFPQLKESEDERIRRAIVLGVRRCADAGSIFGTIINNEGVNYSEVFAWLERQKDLFRGSTEMVEQKPAKWSEEDGKMRSNLMSLLANMRGNRITEETYQKYYPWLKFLPSRPKASDNWKPSEEQMSAFKGYIEDFQARAEAAVGGWNNFDVMIRLYEQLKKLM